MPTLEHPMIEKMNRDGYLGTIEEENTIGNCAACGNRLKRGDTIAEYQDELYCDEDCLTAAFSTYPKKFGMGIRILS